jgi:hypothetical protein
MHCHCNSYALSREESADERLAVIRARIRASLDDPRPNLSLEEVDAHITTLVAKAEQTARYAAAKGIMLFGSRRGQLQNL